jgi:hypothetical protein
VAKGARMRQKARKYFVLIVGSLKDSKKAGNSGI